MASTIRDKIRDNSRLARMRMGQSVGEPFELPSIPGVPLTLVPITEQEAQAGIIAAANLDVLENMNGLRARNRAAIQHDLWYALRDPDDVQTKAFESVEDLMETLSVGDVNFAADALAVLMDFSSPSLDGIDEEGLNDLKKAFAALDLSELSGQQWAAVKLTFLLLLPELLAAKLSGSTSTESSTEKSENEESTSSASHS